MPRSAWPWVLALAVFLQACQSASPTPTPLPDATPTPKVAAGVALPPPGPGPALRPVGTPAPLAEDTFQLVQFIREARALLGERAALQQEFDRVADAQQLRSDPALARQLVARATELRRRADLLPPAAEGRPVHALLIRAAAPQMEALTAALTYAETGDGAAQQQMAQKFTEASRAWAIAAEALRDLATRYQISLEAR